MRSFFEELRNRPSLLSGIQKLCITSCVDIFRLLEEQESLERRANMRETTDMSRQELSNFTTENFCACTKYLVFSILLLCVANIKLNSPLMFVPPPTRPSALTPPRHKEACAFSLPFRPNRKH